MDLLTAERLAGDIMQRLSPYCHKIKIAGSIRRKKPNPKDIEIVAIPKKREDMFGDPLPVHQLLNALIIYETEGIIKLIKKGPKMAQFIWEGETVDLFMVTPPAQWGAIFTIRTGPWQFSKWIMSAALPPHLKQKDGALWKIERKSEENKLGILKVVPTPTEESYFEAVGIDWIPPEERGKGL